jgi:phosphoserine phosphatase
MINSKCRHCYRDARTDSKKNVKKLKNLDLVAFDMDGVLADTISSWKYIHDYFNTSNEESVTEYIQGKIDDMEFIKRDASFLIF